MTYRLVVLSATTENGVGPGTAVGRRERECHS